ncbi:LPXTG cell wall anchor domain-containing protein [Arthrobacter sp. KNU-44]|uniref:LPXTG cell wall anchor domain-containing protein n=1 Tax=unclassified Arthrobacter TaxID=235627 RepID=UPI003F4379FD
MKKSLAVLALASTIALGASAPAMAVDYPAPGSGEQGQVDNGNVENGQQFNFSGGGFQPNEGINVQVEQTGGPQASGGGVSGRVGAAVPAKITLAVQTFATKANSSGRFSLPLTLNATGTFTLTATGVTSGHKVTAVVTVKAAAASGAGLSNTGGTGLANTGVDSSLVLWGLVGAGALAAGTVSVVVARRRAKNETAATA